MTEVVETEEVENLRGGYLWVFPLSQCRRLWVPFARKVAGKLGIRPLFVVPTPQDKAYYIGQIGDCYDLDIVVLPDIYGIVVEEDAPSLEILTAKASAYEKEYDISIMRDFVQIDRHLGRSFMVGWNGLPGSFASAKSSLDKVLNSTMKVVEFYDELVKSYPPELVLGILGHLTSKHVSLFCRKHGIPLRTLAPGRFEDLYFWANDEFENSPDLEEKISSHPSLTEEEILEVEKKLIPPIASTKILPEQYSLKATAYHCFYVYAEFIYSRIRGYDRAKWGYKPWQRVRGSIQAWLDSRYLSRYSNFFDDESSKHRRIVYFPLQTEPEVSLHGQSPEASNQIAYLREIALSAPADTLILVKEHFTQMGRRPKSVYQWIEKLPNVELIGPWVSSIELIKRSHLVCTINGTPAYEAAALGKNVAYLSRHGVIKSVPHVYSIAGYEDFSKLRRLLQTDISKDLYQRCADGARFFHAMTQNSMKLGDLLFYTNNRLPTEGDLTKITEGLMNSLNVGKRDRVNPCATPTT